MSRSGSVVLALIVLFQSVLFAGAQEEQTHSRVGVLPLEVSQQEQYSYLSDAIRQMLISRLVRQGNVEIVDLHAAGKDSAEIKRLLNGGDIAGAVAGAGVDWLADGKLYSMKDGLQLNLTLYPAGQEMTPRQYSLKAAGPDDVMPAISDLAAEIDKGLFKHESEADLAAGGSSDLDGFQTPHPERDYKKGLYGGAGLLGGEQDDRFQSRGIRKSSELPVVIENMVFGDLDNNGTDELVVSSRTRLRIFSFVEGRFNEVAGYDFPPTIKIHAINIDNLPGSDGNRLYVSANLGKYPASAIFSWDGSEELQLRQKNLRWYIRPVDLPGNKKVLAGQKDSPNISDRFLAPGVFELLFDEKTGKIERGPKLLLPPKTNLFDFVIADLNGDGASETILIDEQQKLLIYDEVLNLIWVSSANYGGSNRFFGPAPSDQNDMDHRSYSASEESRRRLVYIPGRMDVKDITGDGLPEIVVNSNEVNDISEYFGNFRGYDGGSVACLTWRGAGLMELWRTNHIEGYVADYAFDGAGEAAGAEMELFMNHLFVAQIPDSTFWDKFIPGGKESKILAYEMVVRKEDKKQ